jgi:hypothetical protein
MKIKARINMSNYWLSRRSKYDPQQLFQVGQQLLLNSDWRGSFRQLNLAASLGHPEAMLIVECFAQENLDSRVVTDSISTRHWLKCVFGQSKDPTARAYSLYFSQSVGDLEQIEVDRLLELAEQGEVMAQHALGSHYYDDHDDQKEAGFWYCKVANQAFVESSYKLIAEHISFHEGGIVERSMHHVLPLFNAANGGSHRAMQFVGHLYQEECTRHSLLSVGITEVDAVILEARRYLENGHVHGADEMQYKHDEIMKNKSNHDKLFRAGRMFDSTLRYQVDEENEEYHYKAFINGVIGLYLKATSKARHASIQTILTLRSGGLVKDVAILIAKLVYSSRDDVVWV